MTDYSRSSARDLTHMLRNWLLQYSGPTEDLFGPVLGEVRRRLELPAAEQPSTLQAAYDAGLAAGRELERAEPHQHTCWECGAKVPRKPEDIARGNANTDAVVAAMAEGDPEPLLEMPDPYPVSHTPRA